MDEEMKRLEDLVKMVLDPKTSDPNRRSMEARLLADVRPATVLALIERVRKAEARAAHNGRLADDASDDVDGLIRRVEVAEEREHAAEERVKAAKRKGVEEMREAAADWVRACSARATFTLRTLDGRPLNSEERRMHGEVETGLKSVLVKIADDIAKMPLPGDAS